MKTTANANTITPLHGLSPRGPVVLLVAAVMACGAGCQPAGDVSGTSAQAVSADNGFSPNGLNRNGLNRNGLNRNGLNRNGLNRNGLASPDFAAWFDLDAPTGDMVMSYVVKCAVPDGETRTWTSPATGAAFTWAGALGLLPDWSAGSTMTAAEEQVLTACLAAHVNGYGVHVWIAIEGRAANGMQIPIGPTELADYPVREAAFFGNMVQDEGVFVCLDHPSWDAKTSSVRACAQGTQLEGTISLQCPPLVVTGACGAVCQADPTGIFYESCTYNGITYRPLATRLAESDIYACGDGVCQFTESCGAGADFDNCNADCGPCP